MRAQNRVIKGSKQAYNATIFMGLGFSVGRSIAHGICLHRFDVQQERLSLGWVGSMASLNALDALIYTTKVSDERCKKRFAKQSCSNIS